MPITFYDLLGIDPTELGADDSAALYWPNDLITKTKGLSNADDRGPIVMFLQAALQFSHVRPGADGRLDLGGGQLGQITLSADLQVVAPDTVLENNTLYLSAMPDIGLRLMNTTVPARCYFARDARGHEVLIENLPLHVTLKPDLIVPPVGAGTTGNAGEFDSSQPDSFTVVQNGLGLATDVYLMARLHLTPGGDIIFEASVPHSETNCVFLGLPAKAIYDLLLIPSPRRLEYFEWARHAIDGFALTPPTMGALAFRSIDFDLTKPPFSDLAADIGRRTLYAPAIELVCEDVVFNLGSPIVVLPLPSHGTFGFRKKVVDRTSLAEAFSLTDGPVRFVLYKSDGSGGDDGSLWVLVINQFQLQTGTPPIVQFQVAFVYQQVTGPAWGGTVAIADDWTVQLGVVADDQSPVKTTIAGAAIAVHALKLGLGLGRLSRGERWSDSWQLLIDLSVTMPPDDGPHHFPFHFVSLTGKPVATILRDVGWSFGRPSFTGLTMPDGAQLMFDDSKLVRVIIEEMAMVEDPDGINRFSFSGGIAVGFGGGDAVQPTGIPQETGGNGFGIRVRRLRFHPRLGLSDETPQLPDDWKCDGISLNLRYGTTVIVAGFGYITDDQANGFAIHEFGFGVGVKASLLGSVYSLAAMFLKGTQRPIDATTGLAAFDYFLASLTVGQLPMGPMGLYGVRLLAAENMVPNVGTQTADNKGLQLYLWHRDHDGAIDMPRDRNLGDWLPQDHAWVAGLGCGLGITGLGAVMHIDVFALLEHTEGDIGTVVALQVYLLKIKRPIGFGALEVDSASGQVSAMLGVELSIADLATSSASPLSSIPAWLRNLATLSGTLYFTSAPTTFAIGQLSDQRTWLGVKTTFDKWSLKGKLILAVCIQYVDDGPKGIGVVLTVSLGADWHLGSWAMFGSLGLIVGQFKTGSDAWGVEGWIQAGFKIDLFHILNMGADIMVQVSYLGNHPATLSWSAQIRLDTPWWMPDVTFVIQNPGPAPQPFDLPMTTRALAAPSAIVPSSQAESTLLTPPLSDGVGDATHLYTFNELSAVTGAPLGDTHGRSDLPIVATDSTIVLNFSNPVSNDMAVGPDTYGATGDAGVQHVQDLTLRYGLQAIAIRRSPRFGPGAGTWTDFITVADTALDLLGGIVHTSPALTFQWDVDVRADGTLSPTRLLLNGATPYTFTIAGAQHDEEAVQNDAGYPCCENARKRRGGMPLHELTFATAPTGLRLPRMARFSAGGGWWQWTMMPTPLAATAAARLPVGASATLGRIDFADAAMIFTIDLTWLAGLGTLVLEGYNGVRLVAQLQLEANATGGGVQQIRATLDAPFTCVVIRAVASSELTTHQSGPATAQVSRLWYVALADYVAWHGADRRCQSGSGATDGGGKLAFLPNTDYEITVTNEIRLTHQSQGTRSLIVAEPVYFRTKGLPGLNAVANVGDELLPYIETTYPHARSIPLYREEPIVLAFSERLSTLLPVDRIPAPTDPPEKTQIMELVLNVDRVVSTDGLQRLTVPTDDWITAHRAGPIRPGWRPIGILGSTLAGSRTRRAVSTDPLTVRYQAVLESTVTCQHDPLHSSQLLVHDGIAPDGTPGPWQSNTGFRATVRAKDGPYTERSGFDVYDSGAFVSQSDGTAPPAGRWTVSPASQLVAPMADNGRQYASFGDLTWNHLQVRSRIAMNGAPAGIAIGVAGGSPVPQALLATVEPDGDGLALVLRARAAGGEVELARQAVSASALTNGSLALRVTAFDDVVRAEVGDARIEGQRGAIRDGRVALVAAGPAAFLGVSVDGLDQYRYDFVTSRYLSYQEHIDSFDGMLETLPTGAAGGTPTTVAQELSARSADVASAMRADADPQQRQALSADVVSALALPLRQRRERVTIARILEPAGTVGFLLESPEPLPITTDVTATLVRHVLVHHWPPFGGENEYTATLGRVRIDDAAISVPLRDANAFRPGDWIVRVTLTNGTPMYAIYDAPNRGAGGVRAVGRLRETVTAAPGVRPELDALLTAPNGAIAIVRPGMGLVATAGGVGDGFGTVTVDVPVALTALSNGDESTVLLFSVDAAGVSHALGSGRYTMTLRLRRARWRSTAADQSATYDQARSIDLAW